jgi:hypothetical protein
MEVTQVTFTNERGDDITAVLFAKPVTWRKATIRAKQLVTETTGGIGNIMFYPTRLKLQRSVYGWKDDNRVFLGWIDYKLKREKTPTRAETQNTLAGAQLRRKIRLDS